MNISPSGKSVAVLEPRIAQLTLRIDKVRAAYELCEEADIAAGREWKALRKKPQEEAGDFDLAGYYVAREQLASRQYDGLMSQSTKLRVALNGLEKGKGLVEKKVEMLKVEGGGVDGNA
jgi:hypothetical protein